MSVVTIPVNVLINLQTCTTDHFYFYCTQYIILYTHVQQGLFLTVTSNTLHLPTHHCICTWYWRISPCLCRPQNPPLWTQSPSSPTMQLQRYLVCQDGRQVPWATLKNGPAYTYTGVPSESKRWSLTSGTVCNFMRKIMSYRTRITWLSI